MPGAIPTRPRTGVADRARASVGASPRSDPVVAAGRSAVTGYGEARRAQRRRTGRALTLLAAGLAAWAVAVATGMDGRRSRVAVATVSTDRTAAWVLAALGAVAMALAWLSRPQPDAERWLRGAAAEAGTAQVLDRLSSRRWYVFHDRRVPGSRANIDHVVIGRTGVWLVDTKSFSQPLEVRWRPVRAHGRRLDLAATRWEAGILEDRLGVPVRPIVAVADGGLPRRGRRSGGVRILPTWELPYVIRRARGRRYRLSRVDAAELACDFDATFTRPGSGATSASPPRVPVRP